LTFEPIVLYLGALNTTATGITVKKQELPPPPKLRDFVDSRITENTVYETDNNFQRDWLTGKCFAMWLVNVPQLDWLIGECAAM